MHNSLRQGTAPLGGPRNRKGPVSGYGYGPCRFSGLDWRSDAGNQVDELIRLYEQ